MAAAADEFRLSPDPRAPALARRRITDALIRAERVDLLETSLLLASELVTNAVLHAGTPVGVELELDERGFTVSVTDSSPGPLTPRSVASGLTENGRGITLVDALAEEWGTRHHPGGKTVWFTVSGRRAHAPAPSGAAPVATVGPARALPLALGDDVARHLDLRGALDELLARVLDVTGADGGEVRLEGSQSGSGALTVRRGEEPTDDGAPRLTLPLRALGASVGELSLFARRELGGPEAGWAALLAFEISLVAQLRRQHEERTARQGWASFLAEASALLAGSLDAARTLALLCQLVVSRLGTWAAVHLYQSDGALELATTGHAREDELPALREQLAALAVAGQLAGRSADSSVALDLAGESAAAVPLLARGRSLGWLSLGRSTGAPIGPTELSVANDLAARAALAIDNARLYSEQVAVASALQSALLPPHLPAAGELDFGACYHSARDDMAVGGDFYDVFPISDERWVLTIGDVCGKGAEAAAVTGVARDVLRLLLRQGVAPSEALAQLNDALLYADHGRFCTVAVVSLGRDAGGWAAEVWSAGHPVPALVGPDGTAAFVGSPGTLLGVLPRTALDLPAKAIALEPGHALVLYTDGITERRRGNEQFGEQGLVSALRRCGGLSAQGVAGQVDRAAAAFAEEAMRDDTAVLVVRIPAEATTAAVVPQRGMVPAAT